MKKGLLASLATLASGAGLAWAQGLPASGPTTMPPLTRAVAVDTGSQNSPGAPGGAPEKLGPPTESTSVPCEPEPGISVPDGPNAFSTELKPKHHLLPEIAGPGRIWASAEYLLWWVKDAPLPAPLVTAGTPAGQGIIGAPGTTVLFGDSNVDYGDRNGGRFSLGFSNENHTWGIEGTYFFLNQGHSSFVAGDALGSTVIARPFVNSITGLETVSNVSFPTAFAGAVAAQTNLDLMGAEANLVHSMSNTLAGSVDLLAGFRYMRLQEDLGITQSSTLLENGITGFAGESVQAPAIIGITDLYKTRNEFFGGQVGAQFEYHPSMFYLQLIGKLAMGVSQESVTIDGLTSLGGTGAPTRTVPGGLTAVAGNMGTINNSVFSLIPEGIVNLGIELSCNVRVYAGYSFLYWDDVVRPGNQINRTVNPTVIPSSLSFGTGLGGPTPPATANRSDFWAHGLTFGLALRY